MLSYAHGHLTPKPTASRRTSSASRSLLTRSLSTTVAMCPTACSDLDGGRSVPSGRLYLTQTPKVLWRRCALGSLQRPSVLALNFSLRLVLIVLIPSRTKTSHVTCPDPLQRSSCDRGTATKCATLRCSLDFYHTTTDTPP